MDFENNGNENDKQQQSEQSKQNENPFELHLEKASKNIKIDSKDNKK